MTLGVGTITCLVFVWFACTAWARPLMLPDEGRYVGVAWEMVRSGDWLTPTLNGLPYFHKPPLFYWITAASLSVFGEHEWAARMASMLGVTMGVMALFLFVRRWSGERTARLTLVAMLAQPLLLIGGQFANLDMLVAGCITATVVLLAHVALSAEQDKPYRMALAGAYAMAALGVLAKGLIGVVIPGLVMCAWLIVRRRWRTLLTLWWWPGLLIFLALSAPWFVAMQQRFPEFLNYFFVVQHFKRFASGGFNNVEPFWFYPVVLMIFFLPWLPWLARSLNLRGPVDDEARPIRALMLVWAAVVVLFFSLPQSKLLGYVLPALPPLTFLVADCFARLTPTSRAWGRWWTFSASASVAVVLAVVAWLSAHTSDSMREFGATLKTQHHLGEPVVMIDSYRFDLAFYAQWDPPVVVVDQWDDPDIALHDSRRKEMADAGHFAPAAAQQRLILPTALPATLCGAGTTWVLGESTAVSRFPFLLGATVAHQHEGTTLWRVDGQTPAMRSALRCGDLNGVAR